MNHSHCECIAYLLGVLRQREQRALELQEGPCPPWALEGPQLAEGAQNLLQQQPLVSGGNHAARMPKGSAAAFRSARGCSLASKALPTAAGVCCLPQTCCMLGSLQLHAGCLPCGCPGGAPPNCGPGGLGAPTSRERLIQRLALSPGEHRVRCV